MATTHELLVIDDNEWIRDSLKDLLSMSGYKVDVAEDGEAGLKKIRSKKYRVVLSDIQMPKVDGIELLKQIKKYDATLPVVMITGFPTVDTAIKAMREGASDFITKPFKYEQVNMVVDKLVSEREAAQKGSRKEGKIRQSKTIESLNTKLDKKVKELSLLYSISESMNIPHTSSEELFNRIVKVATELVEAKSAYVVVFDSIANELIVKAVEGNGTNLKVDSILPIDGSVPWQDVLKDRHLIINKGQRGREGKAGNGPGESDSSVLIPLKIKDSVFGVLSVCDKLDGNKFEKEDVQLLLTLARKASLSVENAILYESMYTNLISTLQSLVAAIEARDSYTQQHSQRVTEWSIRIAEAMGCTQDELDTIKFAGILHDIGKISISDSILLKNGRLTEEEMKMVQTHPVVGERILQPLGLLPIERAIVRHHHERWDGKGYPDGIAGNDIPLLARIIAVADSYDAMTSNRPYRMARGSKEAIDELVKCSGTQFDRSIVDIFRKVCSSKSVPAFSK